jgi:predicted exporter
VFYKPLYEDADMNNIDFSTVQALSIAGSTLAAGIVLGWVLALLQFGTGRSNHQDKEDKTQ